MGNPNGHFVHGLHKSPLYGVWQTMKQRCCNPNCRGFKWYGAKGVKVCDEWLDFTSFYEWAMRSGYRKGLTIDRIDSSKDYEPRNCRWVTMSQQQSNKHNNFLIEYNGEVHTLTEWSKLTGIPRSTLSNRFHLLGWSPERALGGARV